MIGFPVSGLNARGERALIELTRDIASRADVYEAREAEYRANRDRFNAVLDLHRDAGLRAAGLID